MGVTSVAGAGGPGGDAAENKLDRYGSCGGGGGRIKERLRRGDYCSN